MVFIVTHTVLSSSSVLLFLIAINDLPYVIPDVTSTLFADDCSLKCSGVNGKFAPLYVHTDVIQTTIVFQYDTNIIKCTGRVFRVCFSVCIAYMYNLGGNKITMYTLAETRNAHGTEPVLGKGNSTCSEPCTSEQLYDMTAFLSPLFHLLQNY